MTTSTNGASAAAAIDPAAPIGPLQQMLLAQLAGDADDAAGPSMPDLVEQALGDNPFAGPLAAAIRRRQQLSEEKADNEPDETTQESPVADVLRRLYAELEALRARMDLLADALGACPRCWGEDLSCPRCWGRGSPGGRSPEPGAFESFVAPAIRRRRFDTAPPMTAGTSPV
jgi:hypothetical protein